MKDLSANSHLLKRIMSELHRTPTRVTDTLEHIDSDIIDNWLGVTSDDEDWNTRWVEKVEEMRNRNYAKDLNQLDDDREALELLMLERVRIPEITKQETENANYKYAYQMHEHTDAVLNHNNPFAQATTSNTTYTHISREGVRDLQLTKIERLTRQQIDGHSIVTTQPSLRVIDNNIKLEIGDDILTEQRYTLEWRE